MSTPHEADLMRIAADVFRAVGPSRIAAFAIVVTTRADLEDVDRAVASCGAVARLQSAESMLRDGFGAALAAEAMEEPRALMRLRLAALDAIAPFGAALARGMAPTGDLTGDAEGLRLHCLTAVDPDVTAFLEAMIAFFETGQRARDARAAHETMDAVRSASTIGRAIQMIAFNASIEAARCGAEGNAFRVISEEIKTLADRTRAILEEIAGWIDVR